MNLHKYFLLYFVDTLQRPQNLKVEGHHEDLSDSFIQLTDALSADGRRLRLLFLTYSPWFQKVPHSSPPFPSLEPPNPYHLMYHLTHKGQSRPSFNFLILTKSHATDDISHSDLFQITCINRSHMVSCPQWPQLSGQAVFCLADCLCSFSFLCQTLHTILIFFF